MNWNDLLNAIALLLIFEGLLPFVKPDSFKNMYKTMMELPESSLRMFGLVSIVGGLLLLFLH